MKVERLGAFEITQVSEMARLPVEPTFLFGNATPEIIAKHRDWLGPRLVEAGSDKLILSFHSYVIRTPHHTILVDTCVGNDKERPSMLEWHRLNQPYLKNLAAAGVRPEDVDTVLCTHLHADHVGWNTRLVNGRWVPTFPNARYLMARTEFDHFNRMHQARPAQPVNRGSFADSVLPVVEHGRADMIESTHVVEGQSGKGIWLEPAPGHTPGNVHIHVRADGTDVLLCGDVIHHPIQFAEPQLQNPADVDKPLAVKTRLHLMNEYADKDTLILTGHFPAPTAGRIVRHRDRFRFRFEAE